MEESGNNNKFDDLARSNPPPASFIVGMSVHGFKVMMVGFSIAAISAVVLITQHEHIGLVRSITLYTGFTGFGIYVIGRVLVSIQRRARKKYLQTLPRNDEGTV